MKKVAVFMVLLCLIGCSLFADDYTNCLSLINKKLDDSTVATIQQYSVNLTDAQKLSIYESKKSNAFLPFALNLLLGCGIGSYVQGDTLGGTISLCADIGGYALAVGGYLKSASDAASGKKDADSAAGAAVGYLVAGYSVIVANKIFTCIRPFTYAGSYNSKLSNALYGSTSVALLPTINERGDAEVVLTAKVSF